jgi:hypothetical protein
MADDRQDAEYQFKLRTSVISAYGAPTLGLGVCSAARKAFERTPRHDARALEKAATTRREPASALPYGFEDRR